MKKMIAFRIDTMILDELDKEIKKLEKKQKRKLTRTKIIEDAIIDWINSQKISKKSLKQIGVDEEGMPIYRL